MRGIFEAYGGWFHFDSTAELLADAPSSINAEVAALAGADALAARARELLDGGDPGGAIRLAEMALAGEPRLRDALEVYRDAHQALLADAGTNMWDLRWLRRQIRGAERLLAAEPTRKTGAAPRANRASRAG